MARTVRRRDWRSAGRVLAMVCVAIWVMVLAGAPLATAASQVAHDRPPGGNLSNPVVRQIDVASPAIVRLATIYTARLTLTACGQTLTFPQSGNGYRVGGLGSGTFVSAHGDILTADHLVHIVQHDLDQSVIDRGASDIAAFLNQPACHLSGSVTADDVAQGLASSGIQYKISYSPPEYLAWQATTFSGPLLVSETDPTHILSGLLPAPHKTAVVLQSSSFEQNDLALLHVDLEDTPSVQLDDSSAVAVEDTLSIIGFPGNGDVTNNPTNLLTPSVNSISVSAIKKNTNGETLIQVAGNVEHGDSGGPALDAAGHIVGIVSFGGPDTPGSTAFLRSSNSASAVLRAASINTAPGTFQRVWQQAFGDYSASYSGHWHKASSELDALLARYPSFQGAKEYRKYADQAAANETLPLFAQLPADTLVLAGGALMVVGVLLLIVLVVVFTTRSRRRQVALAQAAVSPYGYPPMYGYPPPGYHSPYSAAPSTSAFSWSNGYAPYGGPPTVPPGGQLTGEVSAASHASASSGATRLGSQTSSAPTMWYDDGTNGASTNGASVSDRMVTGERGTPFPGEAQNSPYEPHP